MNQARDQLDLAIYRCGNAHIVISPFLTKHALRLVTGGNGSCILYTRCDLDNFLSMSSDIQAIRYAYGCGMSIRHVNCLHAKIYVFKDEALVGSANCTNRGLSLGNSENWNVEYLASISRDSVIPFIADLDQSSHEMMTEQIENLISEVSSKCDIAFDASLYIGKYLEHCTFPEWCSYERYEDVICNDVAGLPAEIYRDLYREIRHLPIQPTYGSRTAFRKEMYEALLKSEANRMLVKIFLDQGEVSMRKLLDAHVYSEEYAQRLVYWCRWLSDMEL